MLKRLEQKPKGLLIDSGDQATLYLSLCYETGEYIGDIGLVLNGEECYPYLNIPKENRSSAAYTQLKDDFHNRIIPSLRNQGITDVVVTNSGEVENSAKFKRLLEFLEFPTISDFVIAGWRLTDVRDRTEA